MHDDCIKKEQWGSLTEKLKVYDRHLEESDSRGGYRDRVADLERSNKLMPYVCAACAFCGGLCSQVAPELGHAVAFLVGLLR